MPNRTQEEAPIRDTSLKSDIASSPQKNKLPVAFIVIALALVAVGIFTLRYQNKQRAMEESAPAEEMSAAMSTQENTMANDGSGNMSELENGEARTISISGKNFEFSRNEIRLKKGESVRIELTSEQGFHDWRVDEFNASTEAINAGSTAAVEFAADKTGTFEYYCSIGNHRQLGMRGNLIIEE